VRCTAAAIIAAATRSRLVLRDGLGVDGAGQDPPSGAASVAAENLGRQVESIDRCGVLVLAPNRPRSWWLPERGRRRNAASARGSHAATTMPNTSV